MTLVVEGTVVPLAEGDPQAHFDGRVYLEDPVEEVGRIAAVRPAGQVAPAGFDDAPVVDVGEAFIYPGLIDLHSHLGYNTLPLWTEPGESRPFLHHDIWPGRSTYKPQVSWPAWVLAKAAPEALLTYVQVRALAGGSTAIQGWPSANRRPANHLVRNIDDQRFGGEDRTRTSTLTLDLDGLRDRAENLRQGLGFIYHCSEGQTGSRVVREFEDAATAGCLRQRLLAIHCCAVGEPEFTQWEARATLAGDPAPGAVVWSPFSNLWLYGQTTDVPAARRHGITVCLGTDWGPSGTKNLLGELKVARLCSDAFGWGLTDFDLVEMVTAGPGDMLGLCWGVKLGRLEAGALGDVAVVQKRSQDPWENLVVARERDVVLVTVNGEPRYGIREVMAACGARRTTSVRVGPVRRHTVLINPADKDQPDPRSWTWSKALAALDAVRADPVGAVETASIAMAAVGGAVPEAVGAAGDPLVLDLDMPGGLGLVAGPPPDGVVVDIPKMPSLRHDRNWRASVKHRGFHGGLLDDLDSFYV
jgi:cytosine/adenosine deaminase-related metal-dependent hydrolase